MLTATSTSGNPNAWSRQLVAGFVNQVALGGCEMSGLNRDCSATADCRKQRMRVRCSGGLPPPSQPAEKASAGCYQTRQASSGDRAWDLGGMRRDAADKRVGICDTASCRRGSTKDCPPINLAGDAKLASSKADKSCWVSGANEQVSGGGQTD